LRSSLGDLQAGRGAGRIRPDLGIWQLVVFFPFHPPVLEPDFDLALGEAEGVGDLDPAPPGEIAVIVKFLLQLQDLLPGVGCAGAFRFPS